MTLGMLRVAASLLKSRSELAEAMGITFGGARDAYQVLGYKKVLGADDYAGRYARNGLARRIVNAAPMATWRVPPQVFEDEDPEKLTEFEQAFDALAKRLRLWSLLLRADKLAGLGRYSVLLLGVQDGRQLSEPLESVSDPERLLFLAPYSEARAKIKAFDKNTQSARFGLPDTYEIDLVGALKEGATTTISGAKATVHHSRVLHVTDDLLEDNIYGAPRLECVWNLLDDLDKCTGGGAEAFWRSAYQGLHANIADDLELKPEDETAISDEIDEYQHGMRRFIRTRGVEINALGATAADPKGAAGVVLQQISGATGIPLRILVGSERGELASQQDRENWADRTRGRQESLAGPQMVEPLIRRFIAMGVLPEPKDLHVDWQDIQVLSETEQALVLERRATATKLFGTREADRIIAPSEGREALGLPPDRPDHEPPMPPTAVIARPVPAPPAPGGTAE